MKKHDLTREELALLRPDEDEGSVTIPMSACSGQGDVGESEWVDPASIHGQLEVLESFHRELAGRFADALSRSLNRLVEVRLTEVHSMTYSQFAHSREKPTCYFVISAPQLPAPLAVDLPPQLLYPLLDCLLGGGHQECVPPDRPPTELEQRLARGLMDQLLHELHDAWETLLAIDLSIDRIEDESQRVRVVSPGEMVATLSFRIDVADQHGNLTFCLPFHAIRKIVDKLLVGEYHDGVARSPQNMSDESAEVVVQFKANSISPSHLAELRVGDILASEVEASSPVLLTMNDEIVARAQLGALNGQRAVILGELTAENADGRRESV